MSPILCPSCSNPLSNDCSTCASCNSTLSRRSGIISFTATIESTAPPVERGAIERIAELTENGTIRTATNEVLKGRSDAKRHLRAIYDTRSDAWRMLVDDQIEGRCLDLYTGWGRRSLTLAEHVDSVYAVDPDLAKLRVLHARDDFKSGSSVVPIHADDGTLFFDEGTFDTVVADFTGRSERVTADCIGSLDSLVGDDGSIHLIVDGVSRKLGATGAIGLDSSSVSISVDSFRSTVDRCQRNLETLDYDDIRTFVLWPTIDMLTLVYEMENTRGHQHVVERSMAAKGQYSKVGKLVHVADRLGILQNCVPNVLVVGTRSDRESERSLSRPVLSTGRSRNVVFEYDDELSRVQKIPVRTRHSRYNEREHEVIQKLRTSEQQVQEYLPEGELIDSPFGSVRTERPVRGEPLRESVGETPESREEILSLGLDWLLELQQPRQRKQVMFSPEKYIENNDLKPRVFDPYHLPDPVRVFETPIHGDFLPGNIYVENGEITAVIDWEYGSMRGNPIVDAGFFVAQVIAYDRMPASKAMVELSNGGSRFAKLGQRAFRRYCEECDIETNQVLPLLPLVYLHRVAVDRTIGSTNQYTNKERERLARVEEFWSCSDII